MTGLPAAAGPAERRLFAIALVPVAFLFLSFLDSGAKWLAIAGLPVLQITFMRYFGHFSISTAVLIHRRITVGRIRSGMLRLLVVRGILMVLSTAVNFWALRYIPLTLTSTIMFCTPIIVCAVSGPLLGERVGAWNWFAILAGFLGVVIAMQPFGGDFHWATLLSLTGACCFAGYVLLTRRLAGVVPTDTLQFHAAAVGTVVLLPFAIVEWRVPASLFDWTVLVGLGALGWLGNQALTVAHRHAPASVLSPYSYVMLLYLTAWSYLFFDHVPSIETMAGAAIIVAAGLMIWTRERRASRTGSAKT